MTSLSMSEVEYVPATNKVYIPQSTTDSRFVIHEFMFRIKSLYGFNK